MTLTTCNFWKKIWHFFQKNFDYFQKFSVKLLDFGQKMADFTRFWKNWKKKSAKMENLGQLHL